MLSALFLAALALVSLRSAADQALSVLHVKVVLVDGDQQVTPVPRHALLVSDNPASAAPRRIVTGLDGTADVKLRPGLYTVESDQPVAFRGRTYQWTAMVTIGATGDVVLELGPDNAEVAPVTATTPTAERLADDPAFLLPRWQDSVVGIWTANSHASGFVIGANGLIATNQRVIGAATAVEVQLSSTVKVSAKVLVADPARDVAVLWIDPQVAASVRPVSLGCAQARPALAEGQEIFTIGVPLRQQKGMTSATVSRVEPHVLGSDWRLASGSAGGPVFTAGGELVGITSLADDKDEGLRGRARIIRIDDACDVVKTAEAKMVTASPPDGTHLPVEPARAFPVAALQAAAQARAGSLGPYKMSSSDFDIAFITPVLTYAAQQRSEQGRKVDRSSGARMVEAEPVATRLLTDFGTWSEYVGDFPAVLLVRVTPRLVEGFWTAVARGAAMTQGVALPPIKHFKSGLARLRAYCGDAEVTPIHPFALEQRLSESEAIREGLYVFDSGALGPHCATVKLVLHSEKEPQKGDTRVVDPKVLQQIWQDFAPYRALDIGSGSPSGLQSAGRYLAYPR